MIKRFHLFFKADEDFEDEIYTNDDLTLVYDKLNYLLGNTNFSRHNITEFVILDMKYHNIIMFDEMLS